jgi:hypothetical protein
MGDEFSPCRKRYRLVVKYSVPQCEPLNLAARVRRGGRIYQRTSSTAIAPAA